MIEEQILF